LFQELSTRPVFVHDATAQFDIVPGKMGKFLAVTFACHSGRYLRCMTIEMLATYHLLNLFRHCLYCPLAYGI